MAFTANQKRKLTPANHKLKWSHEMRVVLYMIFEEFVFDKTKKKEIFDTIFQEHIAKCGLTDGVPFSRLKVQFDERTKQVANWTIVCQPPTSDAEKRLRADLKQKITDVARSPANARQNVIRVQHYGDDDTASSSRLMSGTGRSDNRTPKPLPLSKQKPIARWAPGTPGISGNKRPSEDSEAVPPPKRPRQMAMVLAQDTIQHRQKPRAAAKKEQLPKSPKKRQDGTTINTRGNEPINPIVAPVPRHLSQPALPDLLFRFFQYSSRDSEQGHWSRRHHQSNVLPMMPPESSSIDPCEIYKHMDKQHIDTPYISTADRLVWIIQQLITKIKEGKKGMHLSVINVCALDPRAIFHARPFHDAAASAFAFSNGAQRYNGNSEWLVFKEIPKSAIIRTFEAEEFLAMVDANQGIAQALSLQVLRGSGNLSNTKIPELRKQGIPLSSATAIAIAQIAHFLGIDVSSPVEHITHVVRDILHGWQLTIDRRSEEGERQRLAGVFEHAFCRNSTDPVDLLKRADIQWAFLTGVQCALGKLNYRLNPDHLAKQRRKAARYGLASPAESVAKMLDAAKVTVMVKEKSIHRKWDTRLAAQPPLQIQESSHSRDSADQEEFEDGADEDENENENENEAIIARHPNTPTRRSAVHTPWSVEEGMNPAEPQRQRQRHRHRPRSRSPPRQHSRPHVRPRRKQPAVHDDDSEDELVAYTCRASQPRQAVPMTPPTTDPAGEASDGEGILYVESDESGDDFDDEDDEWT